MIIGRTIKVQSKFRLTQRAPRLGILGPTQHWLSIKQNFSRLNKCLLRFYDDSKDTEVNKVLTRRESNNVI